MLIQGIICMGICDQVSMEFVGLMTMWNLWGTSLWMQRSRPKKAGLSHCASWWWWLSEEQKGRVLGTDMKIQNFLRHRASPQSFGTKNHTKPCLRTRELERPGSIFLQVTFCSQSGDSLIASSRLYLERVGGSVECRKMLTVCFVVQACTWRNSGETPLPSSTSAEKLIHFASYCCFHHRFRYAKDSERFEIHQWGQQRWTLPFSEATTSETLVSEDFLGFHTPELQEVIAS